MIPPRLFRIVSSAITLATKAVVVVHMLSAGDYEFLSWKNGQEYLASQRTRVFKRLALAIITFRISRRMLTRSVVSFLVFAIVVVKLLSIQVKLVRLARSLKPFNGPVRLTACIVLSGAFFYLRLLVEIAWAVYYMIVLLRNPSVKDASLSLWGLLRVLEWT